MSPSTCDYRWLCVLVLWACVVASGVEAAPNSLAPGELAQHVTIHRDEFGVPHVIGDSEEAVYFGYGYAQAEDNFWQVEDNYILALGRYSEVHGPQGLNSDLLNRSFEIVRTSRRDYEALDRLSKRLYTAFTAGINHYLATHPKVKPRLVHHFEPWHVLAHYRHVALELTFRFTGIESDYLPRRNPQIWAATGSNGWLLGKERTHGGSTMLLANPHMPWFGFAQLVEAHLICNAKSKSSAWNFTGAGFLGSPVLALGHNERLGWTLVTKDTDIADTYRVKFSDPEHPLAYEYDGGWRQAQEWSDTILIRKSRQMEERKFTFRKTHHGPIVQQKSARDGKRTMIAARIAGLYESVPMRQSLQMIRARNLGDFRSALASLQILYMNLMYADCAGNTWFVYTGRIPRRNPQFDWSRPVDGSNPLTEWLGNHTLDELPQVLNPSANFLQNCNSTPFAVTDGDNPQASDYPAYMIRDAEKVTRRSLRSLEILRGLSDATLDDLAWCAFDTEVYWAQQELPKYAASFQELSADDFELAKQVKPYLDHLLAWDKQIAADSTAATLCEAWYEQLYGTKYPGEQLRDIYAGDTARQLKALVLAAERLARMHGSWKVPYGEVFRIQRQPCVADLTDLRCDDDAPSLTSLGGHGPMGVIFTAYYTPSLNIPLIISQVKRYGLIGTSYLATWEFTPEGVRGASLVPFGSSGDPASPHYFDQAELLSSQKLKPEHFTREQVLKAAVRSYHPGDRTEK